MNQSILEERFWRLALTEYMRIKKLPTSQEFGSGIGDEAFMDAIMEYGKMKNADILIATQDDLFSQKAVARGIETVRLDLIPVEAIFNISGG